MKRAKEEQLIDEVIAQLSKPELPRDGVFLLVAKLIEIQHPEKKVVFAEEDLIHIVEPDGAKTQIFLHNLSSECKQNPEERVEIVQRYLRVMLPEKKTSEEPITRTQIVPLVRDCLYRDFVNAEQLPAVLRYLASDLWIIYAYDLPESTTVLRLEDLLACGLNNAELGSVAISNLERILGDIEVESHGDWFSLTSDDTVYLSSSLLLDYVWEFVGPMVVGDVVVAVPARDTVLFTGAGNAEGLSALRRIAADIFTNGNHVISPLLLRRVNATWTAFA